jgi:hypothetical protein
MKKLIYIITEKHDQSTWNASPLLYLVVMLGALFFAGCQKEGKIQPDVLGSENINKANADMEVLTYYKGLDKQTLKELQQARAATAKYQNIKNAFADGYADINLVMPNMGYHFMKSAFVDSVFNPRNPELLVYNKNENGSFELVSVEYAIPINPQSPHVAPEGFTGDADVWDFNTLNTGLWTLHAWVWKNNPEGVFNPTNPLVQVR